MGLDARDESHYRPRSRRGVTFHRSRAVVDGLALMVKRFPGVPENPERNYVLVHGLGVSSKYYELLAAELAQTANVWLVDLPGYGHSPIPHRDVSIADHAQVLGRVIEAADASRPILVGHSMGCQVVTELAVAFPEITDDVILLSPVINAERRTAWQAFRDLAHDALIEPWRGKVNGVYEYFFRGRTLYYLRQVPHMIDYRMEDRLPEVDATTMVVVGDRDPIVPLPWAERVAAAARIGSLRVVPGSHVIMLSTPTRLAGLITEQVDA